MRILVTNDDGYDADGLTTVAAALLDEGHDVVVGAPMSERSGSGSSLGTIEDGSRIRVAETRLAPLGDTPVFALDCPPALATIAFCSGTFGPVPDLVVSGINPGHNTGRSVLFSSTVGAILAARVAGVGGLAVSCGFAPRHRYDTATAVTTRIVDWMTATGAVGLSLNINVPDLDLTALGGIRITTLATKSMFTLRFSRDTEGMHLHRDHRRAGFPPGSDSAAVADGCVSLTALSGVEADNGALADADTRAQLETSILDAIRLAALP